MSPRTSIPEQLNTIKGHLSPSKMAARPAITCHVLDTTIGLPASDIPVTLKITVDTTTHSMTSTTNSDGRVAGWTSTEGLDIASVFEQNAGDFTCVLRFDTADYWASKGTKPFFPYVEIAFVTTGFKGLGQGEKEPHWHVPLLLGPYNYTTYRGS
jgi:5-hydroxyisourate hydrolase